MAGNPYNFGVCGDALSQYEHSVSSSNLVEGKPVYYFINRSNIVVDTDTYPTVGYLGLVDCANVTVRGMNLRSNHEGLLIAFTNSSEIIDNNFENNVYGIYLIASCGNVLSGNNVTLNQWDCIVLRYFSSNNLLLKNNVTHSSSGFNIRSSSNNTLSGNFIANNVFGIYLYFSSVTSISGNNITADPYYGVYFARSAGNNVYGNDIRFTNVGIYLDDSSPNITIYENNVVNDNHCLWICSSDNKVYHNVVICNAQGTLALVEDENTNNTWDDGYPSGGNYWSDYNGTDANYDGIGDTPYVIDANNIDHYPLVTQYIIPEFPSFLIPLLFIIATLLVVTSYKRKCHRFLKG